MTAPVTGHYAQTKDGPVWVGPSRGELAHLRGKLELARAALHVLATSPDPDVRTIALDALRRSET